jgi:DNA invertase Pin-like site-specific DNA recombinase
MMMQMVGSFAEFKRAILRDLTKAGLDAARKHGRIGGRRPKLRSNQQDEIVTMVTKAGSGFRLPDALVWRGRCGWTRGGCLRLRLS